MYCKACGKKTDNGTNFCKKKCRIIWIRKHNIRGAKKYYSNPENNPIHKQFGLTHSCLDRNSKGDSDDQRIGEI